MTAKSDDGLYFHMREVRRLGYAEKGIHEIALLVKHFCVDNKIGRSSCRIRILTGCSEKISDSGPPYPRVMRILAPNSFMRWVNVGKETLIASAFRIEVLP